MHGHLNVNAVWLTLSSALVRNVQGDILYQGKKKKVFISGLDFLIVEVSRSQSDTPNSVGLPWSSDQHIAETST